MGKSSTPNRVKQLGHQLGEIGGFVAAIVAYVVAVSGKSPGTYPQTTAVLTAVVTTIILWFWRWPRITQQSELLIIRATPGKLQLPSLKDRLLDPFRSSGLQSYAFSLSRRRIEAIALILLSLGTATWTGFMLPKTVPEFAGHTPVPLVCTGSKQPDALRVVIADFYDVEPQSQASLEDRLYEDLSERLEEGITICRLEQVVKRKDEALAWGEETQAAIIVWGRNDVYFEAHLEVARWQLPGRDLPPLPSEEIADASIQLKKPVHLALSFLTELTFSEILYLNNQVDKAQQVLGEMLTRAKQQGLEDNSEGLAEVYFFLGFLHQVSSKPDLQQAAVAYSKAFELDPTFYAAVLNRANIYEQLGHMNRALADYALLIEEQSPLASSAYINRAFLTIQTDRAAAERDFEAAIKLDPVEGYWYRGNVRLYKWDDPEGAVDDFTQVVKLKPEAYFFYESLGQAQLIAGQTDRAVQTFQEIIPHLDEESRRHVIQGLRELTQKHAHLNESVITIINFLQEATLP